MKSAPEPLAASFRDPSGFVFQQGGVLYRQVNRVYQPHWDHLINSGLYAALVEAGLLLPHVEVEDGESARQNRYKLLQPQPLPFISYPYEWSFSQLKQAALLTLQVQRMAADYGMTLKDASAYNVQFHEGKPCFIDTLSFEKRKEGRPWAAYGQFCRHFLAPLVLMAFADVRLGRLLRIHLDGIPLDLASVLLPTRSWIHPGVLVHLHLHARSGQRLAGRSAAAAPSTAFSHSAQQGLLDSLLTTVRKLRWKPEGTVWADYYSNTNYSQAAFAHKRETVALWLEQVQPRQVWDLGANDGTFSRLAAERGILTLAFDSDTAAVERCFLAAQTRGETNLLPLLLDLTNPTPGLGWANTERSGLLQRGPVDTILALALIHHLAIGNNVPLERIAAFLGGLCETLIIEFVPKEDSQVQRMLTWREDIFTEYDQSHFETAFAAHFNIEACVPLRESSRLLYRMRSRRSEA